MHDSRVEGAVEAACSDMVYGGIPELCMVRKSQVDARYQPDRLLERAGILIITLKVPF